MTENIVQWVLLRSTDYLASHLGLRLRRKLAEYQTTDFGIIDFAFDTANDEVAVVELETGITSNSKLNYCIEQSVRYKGLAAQIPHPLRVFVLYDRLGTPPQFSQRLIDQSNAHGLELRSYSMLDIKGLYQQCMENLERTSGIYLGRPVAMNTTHLRLMNRLLLPFHEMNTDSLPEAELSGGFKASAHRTVFRVRRTMAQHFNLIQAGDGSSGSRVVRLTELGKRYCADMSYEPLAHGREFDLTHGQRQILLEALTNGEFSKCKVNIYYLLRFIHVTNGEWIPKEHAKIAPERLAYLNNFFGTDYRPGPLTRLVRFTFTQCMELGLVDRIETPPQQPTFKAFLTSLGSRVLGFLELYLHLKREQLQIPLQG